MTSNLLLQRVVELTIAYLVHSTVFLGAAAIVVAIAAYIRRRESPHNIRQINPMIEERFWKLAATMPLMSIPICIYAGSAYELSDWSFTNRFQPTSVTVLDDDSSQKIGDAMTIQSTKVSPEQAAQALPLTSPATDENSSPLTTATQTPSRLDDNSFEIHFSTRISGWDSEQNVASSGVAANSTVDPQHLSSASRPSFDWHRWLGMALLCWLALAMMRLLVRVSLVSRVLRRCQPASTDLQQILNRLAPSGSRIRLLTAPTNTVLEPFACGIWQGTIVLPPGIEIYLTHAEVKALLAHEIAHLIRRDPLWLFVSDLLCTGLAFQPLNFIARRRWLQAAELLCDDWAVQRHVSATSLAACLTRIAELRLDRRGTTWGLAAVGQPSLLAHRVQWLLRDNRATETRSKLRRLRMTAASFALAVLVGAFGPRFIFPTSAEAASTIDDSSEQIAIEQELSAAIDELEHAELLLANDHDSQVAIIISRLRAHIQSIGSRLRR